MRMLGDWIHDPNLWHLNRYSVSVGAFVGLFFAFIPIPVQMLLAALAAIKLRCNLPMSVGLVWITNPLTIPPIFYTTYTFGSYLLDTPPVDFSIELSWDWFLSEFKHIWQPLLLGSFVTGLFFGTLGYFSMQMWWRWHVSQQWKQRRMRRQQQNQ